MIRRREFITLLGGAAAAWPLAARAQPTGKLPIIGFLGTNTASAQRQWTDAFLQRLRELGWIEGRTVAIEYRWADGRLERSAEIVAELVRLKVDVIVTHSAEPVLAAKRATAVIPIIFPVLARPGRQRRGRKLDTPRWQRNRPVASGNGCCWQACRNFARGSTGFSPVGDRGEYRCSCCRVGNARGTGGGQHGWSGNYHV